MARLYGDSGRPARHSGAAVIPLPWVARRPRRYPDPSLLDPDDYIVTTRALIGVGLFLVLFIGGSVWLMETMHRNSVKEDCLMSGRRNCFPIVTAIE